MAFSSNSSGGGPMADINVTPLVDVMLVLLIIFMITAPLMSHKVKVDLPQASLEQKPEIDQPPITLAIEASGQVYWNDEKISTDMLEARLAVLAQRSPQPQVDVRADNVTRYAIIQDVVKKVRLAGIRKVGFVSSPER
jgi:biopolymer transport protein ExbD